MRRVCGASGRLSFTRMRNYYYYSPPFFSNYHQHLRHFQFSAATRWIEERGGEIKRAAGPASGIAHVNGRKCARPSSCSSKPSARLRAKIQACATQAPQTGELAFNQSDARMSLMIFFLSFFLSLLLLLMHLLLLLARKAPHWPVHARRSRRLDPILPHSGRTRLAGSSASSGSH